MNKFTGKIPVNILMLGSLSKFFIVLVHKQLLRNIYGMYYFLKSIGTNFAPSISEELHLDNNSLNSVIPWKIGDLDSLGKLMICKN